jgi:protein phosphatase 2C family protein 2/3
VKAILKGFEEAEKRFIQESKPKFTGKQSEGVWEQSGSCAIVIIILDDICYVANLGDSRALLSEDSSRRVFRISKDHKPNEIDEKTRIEKAGGFIYQGMVPVNKFGNSNFIISGSQSQPWRINPGRLSVTPLI